MATTDTNESPEIEPTSERDEQPWPAPDTEPTSSAMPRASDAAADAESAVAPDATLAAKADVAADADATADLDLPATADLGFAATADLKADALADAASTAAADVKADAPADAKVDLDVLTTSDVDADATAGAAVTADAALAAKAAAPESATTTKKPRSAFRRGLSWIFTRHLCFGGLAGALVFFCLSLTPSLVPRLALMQGVVSGVSVAIGYGLGSLLSSIIRKIVRRELPPRFKRLAWWFLLGSALVAGGLFLYYGAEWQERVRKLMEMDQLRYYQWGLVVLLTVILAYILLVIARLVRGATRLLIRLGDRFMPHHVTVNLSVVIVALLIAGFAQGVLFNGMVSAINSAYSLSDRDTSPWISQPTSELRSGGPNSVVEWDTLGTKGRDFVGIGGGPTVEDIEEFSGGDAMEPIRVYVGLQSADDVRDRVSLAMQELERTGAFDRSVVVVNTTTGTGWVDENVVDSIEFLHGGDTAQVAMQYSYLPSWVSFLVDRTKAAEAGEQMITAVVDRVNSMAPEDRPLLLVFGESLGSFGTESAFTSPENLKSNVDGALLVGPTFVNPRHGPLTDNRDEGSSFWRPIVEGGETFRFAVAPEDLTDSSLFPEEREWTEPRIVYLQNSSDPITYFNPSLLWSQPAWLRGERGPDIDPDMGWIPFITFFQVAADMAFSMDVPAGHGHRYGSNVVDGWVEIATPEGWTDEDTEELRALIDARAEERNARKEAAG